MKPYDGGGGIVLCAVCSNIGMWSVPEIVLAIATLFTCLCWLLHNAFLRLDFRQSCWNISPLVFTIRNLLSLQEAYLLIWNQSKKGLLTVVRMRQHLSVLLELYSVKYPLEYTGQISLPSEYCIFPHTSDSLLNC